MGRSQRHKVIIQGTDSAGKGLSEKQPALRYVNQFANSQAFSVWSGPAGGPLKGSSMVGFPPTLIPPPTGTFNAELKEEGEGGFSDPGQFNLSGNPIYQDLPPSNEGGGPIPPEPHPGPEPEPGMEPTLTAIDPTEAAVGSEDIVLTLTGTNFTDTSVIYFNGGQEATSFISDTELTTIVKPSTASGPLTVQVWAMQGSVETERMDFTFTDAEAPPETLVRTANLGPFVLAAVEDAGDTLRLTVDDLSITVRVGDQVLVEATGNTSVNGTYEVQSVAKASNGKTIVVVANDTVDLANPIEARGRITVLS